MKLLIKNVVKKLIDKKLKISFAESCTGGLLSSTLTPVSGSSKIFNLGIVAYSNQSKIKLLKISRQLIRKYGAVSEQVCFSMVKNVSKIGKTNMSVSITGIAGPSGGNKKRPVGLVYIGLKKGNKIKIKKYIFKNRNRSYIQKSSVHKSLRLILSAVK